MTKSILFASAAALSLIATPVLAGGWGGSYTSNYQSPSYYNGGHNNQSAGGLVNVSPTVNLGGLANGVLAGAAIGSGNNILSGNSTGIGVLGAGTAGLLNNIVGNIRKR